MRIGKRNVSMGKLIAWGAALAFIFVLLNGAARAEDKLTFKDAADVIKAVQNEYYKPLDSRRLVEEFRGALIDSLKEAGLEGELAGVELKENVEESLGMLRQAMENTRLSSTACTRIIHHALTRMLSSLDEAGTRIETPELHYLSLKETGYDKGGAGLFIEEEKDELGRFIVIETLPHFAGERSGMQTGDRVTMIDAKPVKPLSYKRLTDLIRGAIGSEVSITYENPQARKPQTVTIQRKWLAPNFKSVASCMLDQVLYIRITFLGENFDREISRILNSPEFSKAKKIIFDLRNNGGNLEGGRALAGSFLPRGSILVSRAEGKSKEVFKSTGQTLPLLPMAILLNEKSGSSSVLFAGIMQDYGKATVVGMPSKWEDNVTAVHNLPDGSTYSITNGYYVLPRGRVLMNRTGIKPDVMVKKDPFAKVPLKDDRQLKKALELLEKS
jgi:carboxyl-terminal processing protease